MDENPMRFPALFAQTSGRPHHPGGLLAGWPIVAIAFSALALLVPFFIFGSPAGYDYRFHVDSWMEILDQWHQGTLYPRWAALTHEGLGEARFVFYPPASVFLGAALGAVLPWNMVPGAYVWVALTLSGCSMFILARRWLNRPHSVTAAVLYALNPYFILIIFLRSAYAELLAGALLPLLLLSVLELAEQKSKAVVHLALVVAAVSLINLPAAVMIDYSLICLAASLAVLRRSPWVLWYAAIAGLMGTALAGIYLVPAWYEQRWADLSDLFVYSLQPGNNFLFGTPAGILHLEWRRHTTFVGAIQIAVFISAALGFPWRRIEARQRGFLLLTWGLVCIFLMVKFSAVIWSFAPLLHILQFPWRWLLCLSLIIVPLSMMASRSWLGRAAVLALMVTSPVLLWYSIRPPWWKTAPDMMVVVRSHLAGTGGDWGEYVPADARPPAPPAGDPADDAALVKVEGAASVHVQVQRWDAEARSFVAESSQPAKLVIRLFNYPAWRVDENGRSVPAETHLSTGQILIPIPAGVTNVRITFSRTWDRTVGAALSLAALAVLCMTYVRVLSSRSRATKANQPGVT
jgi:6-pyruvoyl-tetrahydropterin synthase related domain